MSEGKRFVCLHCPTSWKGSQPVGVPNLWVTKLFLPLSLSLQCVRYVFSLPLPLLLKVGRRPSKKWLGTSGIYGAVLFFFRC